MQHFIKIPAPEKHGLLFTDLLDAARFWSKVSVGGADDCWPFTGSLTIPGHGQFRYKYVLMPAHRLAYMDAKGPIPDGLYVRHTCDNRPCCNPAHLLVGTQKQNIQDMIDRGRGHWQKSFRGSSEMAGEV